MAEAEAAAAVARAVQTRAITAACMELVGDVVHLASAEAEAMLAMAKATKAIQQMRESRRTVELSAKAMERSKVCFRVREPSPQQQHISRAECGGEPDLK
jgi:hypothetical protein